MCVGEKTVDALTTDVKLLLAAGLLAAWLGVRRNGYSGSTKYAIAFGVCLFSAGLRYTGVWH